MIDQEMAQAMKTAIEMEKSGHHFFTEAAIKVQHPVGKKLFNRLAAEEIDHLRTFERIFSELSKGSSWSQVASTVVPKKRVPYFDKARKEFEPTNLTVELDCLKQALDLERKAIDFFENAIRNAKSEGAKTVYTRILEEERAHYDLIQSEIDSINSSGFWFDVQEFKMDGQY
ncbi:MAG: ferritin family protein [bacterium]